MLFFLFFFVFSVTSALLKDKAAQGTTRSSKSLCFLFFLFWYMSILHVFLRALYLPQMYSCF